MKEKGVGHGLEQKKEERLVARWLKEIREFVEGEMKKEEQERGLSCFKT